ncbi:MAG: hypothetical protein FJ265_20455 [Planctomycetes bacterium]|nr:hypothetical protein [Planctomycetota bacterium]
MTSHVRRLLSAAALALPAAAQSFLDLTEVRNPANPYFSVFEIEAGAIGTEPAHENEEQGLESDISWDGHVYWRDNAFGTRRGTLEAYAGRDGLYGGFYDGKFVGDETVTRLEVRARPWQFYRDGFYGGGKFVPRGLYEGRDYEGYLGFGKDAQGLYIELGPYYRQNEFASSARTGSFRIPEDYAAYGGRLYLEQSSVQMDRRRGMPRDGFVLTLLGEREWNDSEGTFGEGTYLTELRSSIWRIRGRLEWYIPSSDDMTWEILVRGGYGDKRDRVVNFDSTHPLGHRWVDAQLRLRMHLGASWTVTPFAHGQYSGLLDGEGLSNDEEFFVGGGVESYLHLSESFSLHGFYSYLDNPSRPSIRVDEDVHGEHMFYLGLVMRFGSTRR